MEFKDKLHNDILELEQTLNLVQDEKAYNDKSEFFLLNRLAELRIISVERKIIEQGTNLMNEDRKHDSPEMKKQLDAIRLQIEAEKEKNSEYEFQYENFANIYLGQDNSIKGEMLKILNEYEMQGINVNREIIEKTDEYMFDNYAFTNEKFKKANSDGDTGGLGLGQSLESDVELD
ncbi:MAG: hypothetical protein MJ245_02890 [Clostridia bacterium]|nr:hypothetical protein [Clostridia bacterium]